MRHSGRLPSIKVGIEKNARAARASLTVTPPIAMSKLAGEKIVEQIDPHGRHEDDPHAEGRGEVVRHVDIGALIGAVGPLQAERRVVAGRADAQDSGGADAGEGRRCARLAPHQVTTLMKRSFNSRW